MSNITLIELKESLSRYSVFVGTSEQLNKICSGCEFLVVVSNGDGGYALFASKGMPVKDLFPDTNKEEVKQETKTRAKVSKVPE